jgi:hypothetical protein
MYLARKAEPKASKLLFKKELEMRAKIHKYVLLLHVSGRTTGLAVPSDGACLGSPTPSASPLFASLLRCVRSTLNREKMRSMKPSVDNKAPPRFKHMKRNLKKEQMDEGEDRVVVAYVTQWLVWAHVR